MKPVSICRFFLIVLGLSAIAVADFIGGSAHALTMDFVPIGNAGNAPDTRFDPVGFGSVNYNYSIGKYEVTAGQ